jgi:hypothetical protein
MSILSYADHPPRGSRTLSYLKHTIFAWSVPIGVILFEGSVLRWNKIIGSPVGNIGLQILNAEAVPVASFWISWALNQG